MLDTLATLATSPATFPGVVTLAAIAGAAIAATLLCRYL